jgi:hypothetical protein
LYALTGPSLKQLKCDVWGHINNTIIPEQFAIPETATMDALEKKNGEHSAKWTFTAENPKPIYHLYEYTKIDMHFTVFLSRFDQSLVHVEVEPNPLGGKISISTLDVDFNIPNEFIAGEGEFALPVKCQQL